MIRRKAEIPESLRIAVVGYNAEQTIAGFSLIIESLRGSDDPAVRVVSRVGKLETKSGNFYEAILTDNPYSLGCTRYDQLIIIDDNRWSVLQRRTAVIDYIRYRLDENIPTEFQVQFMEV